MKIVQMQVLFKLFEEPMEVWFDTEWESLAEAQKHFPKEKFRIVQSSETP